MTCWARALALVSVVVTVWVGWPALSGVDGFPASTQPMYASVRSGTADFITARRVVDGTPVALSMALVASTDDPLVAERRMRSAVERDADAACRAIAERVRAAGLGGLVEVLEQTWAIDQGMTPVLVGETVVAQCGS